MKKIRRVKFQGNLTANTITNKLENSEQIPDSMKSFLLKKRKYKKYSQYKVFTVF